jgi:hypothetical protein
MVRIKEMSSPSDPALYKRVKARVYKSIPKHSAYRSGIVVQQYKRAYKKKHGSSRSPYRGSRSRSRGLSRWFREKWRNQRGEVGYKYKSDVYRPTRRVSRKTPRTFKELGSKRISRARREKSRSGHVRRF